MLKMIQCSDLVHWKLICLISPFCDAYSDINGNSNF